MPVTCALLLLGCGGRDRAPAEHPQGPGGDPTPSESASSPESSSNGTPAGTAVETFPLGCHRVERPPEEQDGPPSALLCIFEDRFVMWDRTMHESRYVVWTERGADVWSGFSPGDYSRTLELRVERHANGDVFVLGGQRAPLRNLSPQERERAEAELEDLPTIEEICEPAHRCLKEADRLRAEATGEVPSAPLVLGKSVVECQIQWTLALRMIPEGAEIPSVCRR